MKKMKLASLLIVATIITQTSVAQKTIAPHPYNQSVFNQNLPINDEVRGISPMTAFLLLDLYQKEGEAYTEEELTEKYALIRQNGQLYASSFITTKNGVDVGELEALGILTNTIVGNTTTALIPIHKIRALTEIPNIKYIEIGTKAHSTMDSARIVTNVNQVHQGASLPKAYKGEGVVLGIIDEGFDYTHPNFFDSTGKSGYRVKRVWEQRTRGTAPAGFTYGRELKTEADILAAGRDINSGSHASHVAGIAGGSGGGIAAFTGIAPKSDLVFVATTMTIPNIFDGINYIQRYAASVNKPCVINMSLGSQLGPHDGTSSFDNLADSFFVGEGRILVGSAGNDGDKKLHLSKTFTTTDTTVSTFVYFPNATIKSKGTTVIDIWGEPGKDYFVSAHIYNTNTDNYEASTPFYNARGQNNQSHSLTDSDNQRVSVSFSTGLDGTKRNPRSLIQINTNGQSHSHQPLLIEVRAKNNTIHMWSVSSEFSDNGYSAPIKSGDVEATISEIGGTAKKIITVGSYVSKNRWKPLTGNSRSNSAVVGDIAASSSRGPLPDGRVKPDITAPGKVIASSVNSYQTSYDNTRTNVVGRATDNNKSWYYAVLEGTSMASPMVAGTIALWLEMSPDLTFEQITNFLKNNAIVDSFTGTIPAGGSNTWGFGKLNALLDISTYLPSAINLPNQTDTICEASSVTLTAPSGYLAYKWNNGKQTQSITVNEEGDYKVKIKDSTGFYSTWSNAIQVIDVTPDTPSITQSGDTLISSPAQSYQWYLDNNPISGATGQKHIISKKGKYKVEISNEHNCSNTSAQKEFFPTNISIIQENNYWNIYPNPANDYLNIRFNKDFKELSYKVYDNLGKIVHLTQLKDLVNGQVATINTSSLSNGLYTITFNHKGEVYSYKFVILR